MLTIDIGNCRQAIVTRYCGPTNARQSRIKATAAGGTTYLSYDAGLSAESNHAKAARQLADKFGWTGNYCMGGLPNSDYVFVFTGEKA